MASGGPDRSIFADRTALAPDRYPADSVPQETIDALRTYLSPALWETGPASVLLSGPARGRHRAAVDALCRSVDAEFDDTSPSLIAIDCGDDGTAYDLAITIANTLSGESVLASSGYARETVFRRMRHWIRTFAGTPILRLDGVERLASSELALLRSGLFDGGSIVCGFVAVAEDPTYRNALDPTLRDRFHGAVYVPADGTPRQERLRARADSAFQNGGYTDDAIDRCLAVTSEVSSPFETALNVLERAGEVAEAAGDATLRPAHVERAWDRVRRESVAQAIAALSTHERLTLDAVLTDDGGHRFRDVYDRYCTRSESIEETPNRERSVHNYLDTLESVDLVASEKRHASDAGTLYEYRLDRDPELVRNALKGKLGTYDN